MNNINERAAMAYAYMKELDSFREKPVQDDFSLRMLGLELIALAEHDYEWIPISKWSEEVGFFIVSARQSSVDYVFEHCYVKPEYRRQGYSQMIHDMFVEDYGYPAVYGTALFDKNKGMKAFLDQFVKRHNGWFLSVTPTRHPGIQFYRFQVNA